MTCKTINTSNTKKQITNLVKKEALFIIDVLFIFFKEKNRNIYTPPSISRWTPRLNEPQNCPTREYKSGKLQLFNDKQCVFLCVSICT